MKFVQRRSPVAPTGRRSKRPASLSEVELDLREDMRAGREPFSRIMAAVGALEPDETLMLRTIFEPVPLFTLMAKRGFSHAVEPHAADDWSVWFWREEQDDTPYVATVQTSETVTPVGDAAERPTVWLDVRGLEPPEPLVRTLAALEQLPAGHQLVQINVRVPQLLLPMLSERGFACDVDESTVDEVRVRIWRVDSR